MGVISIEHTDRLYWLGRYTERVYTTNRFFAECYDTMLDQLREAYDDFCRRLEIPNIYTSSRDFVRRYCFDSEDTNSIFSNLLRAYDNAVVLREAIGSETLSYVQLALYAMQRARLSDALMLELQKVNDNIVAFWGMADDRILDENTRNIIKVGKRVERIDLYARLHFSGADMSREVSRLTGRLPRTQVKYDAARLAALRELVQKEQIDYPAIVQLVGAVVQL